MTYISELQWPQRSKDKGCNGFKPPTGLTYQTKECLIKIFTKICSPYFLTFRKSHTFISNCGKNNFCDYVKSVTKFSQCQKFWLWDYRYVSVNQYCKHNLGKCAIYIDKTQHFWYMRIMHRIDTNTISYKNIIFVDVDGINKIIRGVWLTTIFSSFFSLRIDLDLCK